MPSDRFYDNYSFSLHFGYGPEDEYNKIKTIIEKTGINPHNENVRLSMQFVRSVAIEAKRLGSKEIQKIDNQTNKEKVVGGITPTDITIAYEVLRQALELATYGIEIGTFCYLAYKNVKAKFSRRKNDTTNIIQNETLKVIKKIIENNKSSKIISEQYQTFAFRIGRRNVLSTSKKKRSIIKQSFEKKKESKQKAKKENRKKTKHSSK